MIKYFLLKILKFFDLYYQLKLFSFLKRNNYQNFDIFFDIGAHEGESIILFSKHFNIKKIYSFEPSPFIQINLLSVSWFGKKSKFCEGRSFKN